MQTMQTTSMDGPGSLSMTSDIINKQNREELHTTEVNESTMAGPLHARKSSTGWGRGRDRLKPVSDPLDSVGFTSKGDTGWV